MDDLISAFDFTLDDYDEYTILEHESNINLHNILLSQDMIKEHILDGMKRYNRYLFNIRWGNYEYIKQEIDDWLNMQGYTLYKLEKMNEIDKKLFKIVCYFCGKDE